MSQREKCSRCRAQCTTRWERSTIRHVDHLVTPRTFLPGKPEYLCYTCYATLVQQRNDDDWQRALNVFCVWCGASPGDACHTLRDGKPRPGHIHTSRQDVIQGSSVLYLAQQAQDSFEYTPGQLLTCAVHLDCREGKAEGIARACYVRNLAKAVKLEMRYWGMGKPEKKK